MYSVCTVRVRPIRAEGLTTHTTPTSATSTDTRTFNPFLVAQILPWKKTRRSEVLHGTDANPNWITHNQQHQQPRPRQPSVNPSVITRQSRPNAESKQPKYHVDLPYYGHPLPGTTPTVRLLLMNHSAEQPEEEETEQETDRVETQLIGRSEVDLRPLLAKKSQIHAVSVFLEGSDGKVCGKLVCSVQFVLTGTFRLTIMSGTRLRSNLENLESIETYIKGKLLPGRSKSKKSSVAKGNNPNWGRFKRQPTLANFYSLPSFAMFNSSVDFTKSKLKNNVNSQRNVLEFTFKDEDRTQIPRIVVSVYDKADTPSKRDLLREKESQTLENLSQRLSELKKEKNNSKLPTDILNSTETQTQPINRTVTQVLSSPVTQRSSAKQSQNSPGFLNFFLGRNSRPNKTPTRGLRTKRAFKEIEIPQSTTINTPTPTESVPKSSDEELIESNPQQEEKSEEELALLREIEVVRGRLAGINKRLSTKSDLLIGRGSIDLRPLLTNYDGIRKSDLLTIDLNDSNGLNSGQLHLNLEFINSSYDPTQEIIKLPDALTLSDLSLKDLRSLSKSEVLREVKKFYLFLDLSLDKYSPNFIIETSNETGMNKIIVFGLFMCGVFSLLLSVWIGLGNKFMSYLIGVLYPIYNSYLALESKNIDLNNQWLTYWIIYGLFTFIENTLLIPLIIIYPFSYYTFKLILLIYLVNPKQLGASIIYYLLIKPLFNTYQQDIDTYIQLVNTTNINFLKEIAGVYNNISTDFNLNHVEHTHALANIDLPHDSFNRWRVNSVMREISTSKRVRVLVEGAGEEKEKTGVVELKEDMEIEDLLLEVSASLGVVIEDFYNYQLRVLGVVGGSVEVVKDNKDINKIIQIKKPVTLKLEELEQRGTTPEELLDI